SVRRGEGEQRRLLVGVGGRPERRPGASLDVDGGLPAVERSAAGPLRRPLAPRPAYPWWSLPRLPRRRAEPAPGAQRTAHGPPQPHPVDLGVIGRSRQLARTGPRPGPVDNAKIN